MYPFQSLIGQREINYYYYNNNDGNIASGVTLWVLGDSYCVHGVAFLSCVVSVKLVNVPNKWWVMSA